MTALVASVRDVVDAGGEADETLRQVVDAIADKPGIRWAAVAFVEGGELVLGPSAGSPDETSRVHAPVLYQGNPVAELWVDGEVDEAVLSEVSTLIAELCLVGWDTGGEPWDPAG